MLLILLATSVTAIFVVTFVLLAKRLKLQWFLSDMYFVIVLSVMVLGPELRFFSRPLLIRDIAITLLNCVSAEFPILVGSLWGLVCAQRTSELRIFLRCLFIVACAASNYGVVGIAGCLVVSALTFWRVGLDTAILLKTAPYWLLSLLLLIPGLLVHLNSRNQR